MDFDNMLGAAANKLSAPSPVLPLCHSRPYTMRQFVDDVSQAGGTYVLRIFNGAAYVVVVGLFDLHGKLIESARLPGVYRRLIESMNIDMMSDDVLIESWLGEMPDYVKNLFHEYASIVSESRNLVGPLSHLLLTIKGSQFDNYIEYLKAYHKEFENLA
jgi:hypothetical protein